MVGGGAMQQAAEEARGAYPGAAGDPVHRGAPQSVTPPSKR